MNQKLKTLWKRPEGKLVLACIAMVIVWGGIFISMNRDIGNLLPTEMDFDQIHSDLRKLKAENQSLNRKKKDQDALRQQVVSRLGTFWIVPRDGEVEYKLREMLDTAIRSQKDVALSSLGSVRTTKISGALFYADLDVTFSGQLEDILTVLETIEAFQPDMAWKRVDFRLDFQRREPNGGNSGTSSSASGSTGTADNAGTKAKTSNIIKGENTVTESMRFNGTVRVICSDVIPDGVNYDGITVNMDEPAGAAGDQEGIQKK